MRQLATAFLILIAFSALAATDAELIAAGRAALNRGDVDQAIAQFEKAVTAKPDSPEAHYYLGLAYGRQAQTAGMFGGMSAINKAKDEWLRAVELNPNFVDARLRLIEFYVVAPGIVGGSEEKAIEQAAELKKRDSLNGHRAYARIYTLQKKLDLAVKEMVEAVREQPKSAKAHYFLGNALLNQKDWKGSLHEYEMALSIDAAYMPPYFRIGQHAAQSESNYARGEEAIRKYLAYKPADDEPGLGSAWYWLGMIQEKQGKKEEARQSYMNALKLTPDSKDATEALKRVS
jgi:tetratricopeptide (TPR) repeat protein